MIFKKPDMKYTEMAMWIDSHVYTDDCDPNTLFEYIYHLVNMLAHQAGYFRSHHYYDDFAIMGATRIFFRLTNPKQKELDENGNPKMEKIKSVLNYIKSIIYPMKVTFEQENYSQNKPYNNQTGEVEYDLLDNFRYSLNESVDKMNTLDFTLYLQDIAHTAREFLSGIPQKRNSSEWMNIYASCMLSLLNSITLNNKNKERIKSLGEIILQKPQLLTKIYKEERVNSIILFHLGESMRGYITVLVNRLKHLISADLSATATSYIPTEMTAKNLLLASLEEEEGEY